MAIGSKDKEVRPFVVVVVAGDDSCRRADANAGKPRGRRREAAALVDQDLQPSRTGAKKIQIAIAVKIEERDRAHGTGCGSGCVGLGEEGVTCLGEREVRRGAVNELGLRPGGGKRLAVSSLAQVSLRVGDAVSGVPQRFEALHGLPPIFRLPGPCERQGSVVGSSDVVRLRGKRFLERHERFLELPLLQMDLPDMDAGARVRRIEFEHPAERGSGGFEIVFRTGNQPEHEVSVGRVGQQLRRLARLREGRRRLSCIELRNSQVQSCDGQSGSQAECLPEKAVRARVVELLQVGDPDVVRAVRTLPLRKGALLKPPCKRTLGTEQQHSQQHRGSRARHRRAPVRVIPFPSTMVIDEPGGAPGRRSVRPFGQTTSIPVTLAEVPRPNVSGNSLCER